jgi:hypothetical protein
VAQVTILLSGSEPTPLAYTVPSAQDVQPLVCNATFDGSGAGGAFLPTIEIVNDAGIVISRVSTSTKVAAGASAEVTFAPFLRDESGAGLSISENGVVVGSEPVLDFVDSGDVAWNVTDTGSEIQVRASAGALAPLGYLTETFPINLAGSSPVALQEIYAIYFPYVFPAGTILSGLIMGLTNTTLTFPTIFQPGILDTTGKVLAVGNTPSTSVFGTVRLIPLPFTAPYTVVTPGPLFGLLNVWKSTTPSPSYSFAANQTSNTGGWNNTVLIPSAHVVSRQQYATTGTTVSVGDTFNVATSGSGGSGPAYWMAIY